MAYPVISMRFRQKANTFARKILQLREMFQAAWPTTLVIAHTARIAEKKSVSSSRKL